MYRRKTVQAMTRRHEAQIQTLLDIIKDQADRLMFLAGRQFSPTPLDLVSWAEEPVDLDDDDLLVDPAQLPDEDPVAY